MAEDVMKQVDRLLKDREKYETWLTRLESEKSESSGRAYSKVREDYQKRLDDVLAKLKSHSDSIRAKLGELESQVGALEEEHSGRAEQLDEARLRHSVGEYGDDKEWKQLEGDLLGALQETESQLEEIRGEIGRLEEIVVQVEGAEAAPAPVAAAAEPEAQQEPAAEPVSEPEPEPVAATAEAVEEDEGLITLEELVLEDEDMEGVEIKAEPVVAEAKGSAETEAGEAGVGDELAFLESLSLSGAEPGEAESFSFLEQRGSGTPQTIICPHCSAANDPAEWYCTECGEELPAE